MKRKLKLILSIAISAFLLLPNGICAKDDVQEIVLSSTNDGNGNYSFTASVDGQSVTEYDYVWHLDLKEEHEEVKNSPAEYHTGNEPTGEEAIYIAHDIYYYPELDAGKFVQGRYGDDTEWLYYYEIEGYENYVFATLPVEGNSVNTTRMHSESEAYNNAVLHICKAGTYRLTGTWHGQIFVDLGNDSFDDETAVVTLILDNVNIECTVAAGICFYQVYECDNQWEDREESTSGIDTSAAGANIIIADGSENSVTGTNIYRILKTKYKNENDSAAIKEQKKVLKIDGTVYSFMSMNIDGEEKGTGVLNINAGFEGLDTELHLTINGGNINIVADNDGINVNEDNVSVFTMNGGTLQILAGTGTEGDGIDSNGYLNINGGTVISSAKPQSDSGLDSDKGTFINGGNVIAFGSSMDVVDEYNEDSENVTMNLVFSAQQNITNCLVFANEKGNAVFGYDLSDNNLFKSANRTYQCLIVSCDAFKVNDNYCIYQSSSISGKSENGIYSSVSRFDKETQLAYSSSGKSDMRPEGMGGFSPEDIGGFNPGDSGQFTPNGDSSFPEGAGDVNPGDFEGFMPNGNNNPDEMGGFNPNGQGGSGGFNNGQNNQMPSQQGGQMQPDNQNSATAALMGATTSSATQQVQNSVFTAEDKVNTFSGVTTFTNVDAVSGVTLSIGAFVGALSGTLLLGGLIGFIVTKIILEKKKTQ